MDCVQYGSENVERFGKDRSGNRRHQCRDCGRTFIDRPADRLAGSALELKPAAFGFDLLCEGMHIRAVSRTTDIDKNVLGYLILRGLSA